MHNLNSAASAFSPTSKAALQFLLFIYGTSIVLGRLYCGMHGFLDVVAGCLLGALLGFIQCSYGAAIDAYVLSGGIQGPLLVALVVLVLVRIHPEPADSCPCFDDSVAFAGVMIGVELGGWHFGKTRFGLPDPIPGSIVFDLEKIGWVKAVLRIILGVATVFVWREVMKPSLLRVLPPLFRLIEKSGFSLPRRFFTQASYGHPCFLFSMRNLAQGWMANWFLGVVSINESLITLKTTMLSPTSRRYHPCSHPSAIHAGARSPLDRSRKPTLTRPSPIASIEGA